MRIQKLNTATGEALRVHDRHGKPFLMLSEEKYFQDLGRFFWCGVFGGCMFAWIGGTALNGVKTLVSPITAIVEVSNGITR